jgi:GH18 family chitinase
VEKHGAGGQGTPDLVCAEKFDEFARGDDGDGFVVLQSEQVVISGEDGLRLRFEGALQDAVVIGIVVDGVDRRARIDELANAPEGCRPGYQFSQVPFQELTHLIYSNAKPTARGDCEIAHPDLDVPNLLALKRLRAQNPRLLVLLSVGGWSGSTYFSDVAATPSARRHFSASCLRIVEQYGIDGLDIDWEYPVTGGKLSDHKRTSDKENYVLLLKQLRSDLDAFGRQRHLLLTIASTCYRNHLNDLSLKEMSDVLDWFNLMGYDFNEMQPKRTSHNSGLFAWSVTPRLNADASKYANSDAAVQWYLNHGVPPEKIVLGVPFYGQVWAGVPNKNEGLYEPYRGRPGEEGVLRSTPAIGTIKPKCHGSTTKTPKS